MGLFSSIFTSQNDKQVKRLSKIADKVEALEGVFSSKTDEELRECTNIFKERYNRGESLDSILPEAFACVREASARVLGMKHFHVQIMGGIALHEGRIAEMYTGEGKTLVATLPAYLNALTGKGVHIVTVNEYLATRDAEWMGRVYKFLGLTVGIIYAEQSEYDKRIAYNSDITYGTNSEFGFDYLRDNMAVDLNRVVQRDLVFALVDEVDSILIDEARTPLVISGFSSNEAEDYKRSAQFAKTLIPNDSENEDEENGDFIIDEETNGITLTQSGVNKAEKFFKVKSIEEDLDVYRHVRYAIKAEFMMKKDKDYIILDGEVVIVDEFTGRIMTGRRYNGGLHQAIEAKEGVEIRNESKTYASITFQNYFRLYTKLSGMTGTAKTEEEEFNEIYNLDVICIPTNKPILRVDEKDRIYVTKEGKINGILEEIKKCYEKGQPVLVGTLSVDKSEALSQLLKENSIPHTVLNAKEHKKEAEIVAQAGKFKSVTISTNMAGRGTDIMLGGNPEFVAMQRLIELGYSEAEVQSIHGHNCEEYKEVKQKYAELLEEATKDALLDKEKVIQAGGLCIIGTEKHENRRIDNQLRGRSGRQGDVGRSVFFTSAEDDLLRINATEGFDSYISLKNFPVDKPIDDKYVFSRLEDAQKYIESRNFRTRKTVLSYDDVINSQRMVVYADRKKILMAESVHEKILSYIPDVVAEIVQDLLDYRYDYRFWNYEELNAKLEAKILPTGANALTMSLSAEMNIDAVIDGILAEVIRCYEDKKNEINAMDCDGGLSFDEIEKKILLTTLDRKWQEHIEALEDLNTCIGLRAIGHYDPITSFQIEGMKMFDDFVWDLKKTVVLLCLKFEVKKIDNSEASD